jgi:hypothetical protein
MELSLYSSFEGELLAAIYFVRLWRQYLYGERFVWKATISLSGGSSPTRSSQASWPGGPSC